MAPSSKIPELGSAEPQDPVELMIHQEVEEFLRDLTLEYPFSEIFEILRRQEFKNRYGTKISPLPKKGLSSETLEEINERISEFREALAKQFGKTKLEMIEKAFRFFSETTVESGK